MFIIFPLVGAKQCSALPVTLHAQPPLCCTTKVTPRTEKDETPQEVTTFGFLVIIKVLNHELQILSVTMYLRSSIPQEGLSNMANLGFVSLVVPSGKIMETKQCTFPHTSQKEKL